MAKDKERVLIGGHGYKVEKEKSPVIDDEVVEGYCDSSKCKIILSDSLVDEKKAHVLMHEIIHAIEFAYDTMLDEDYDIRNHKVDVIAQGVLAFIRQNPHIIEEFVESYK